MMKFEVLKGMTLKNINNREREIIFETEQGDFFQMHHWQSCCERVYVEDIIGDLNDLLGSPLLVAEERSNIYPLDYGKVEQWTFYELATIKGSVTIRWYGTSNGYYSTSVSFDKIDSDSPAF